MRNILINAVDDWANVGYELYMALKTQNENVNYVVCTKHPFNYPDQEPFLVSEKKDIVEQHSWATDIIFMHSIALTFSEVDYSNKNIYPFHGGTIYRTYSNEINKIFNPIAKKTIIQTRDLWDLGAERKEWLLPCVDTHKLLPTKINNEKLIIGHHPSSPIKGTVEYIIPVINKLKNEGYNFDFKCGNGYLMNRIDWNKNIEEMSKCDIYIEAVYPPQYRIKEWGVTALEAAALGKVVVTNFASTEIYKKEYGTDCPFIVCNTCEELISNLRYLLNASPSEIRLRKRMHRDWVVKYHSRDAVGKRMMEKIFGQKRME